MAATQKGETSRSELVRRKARTLGIEVPLSPGSAVPEKVLERLSRSFKISRGNVLKALARDPWKRPVELKAKASGVQAPSKKTPKAPPGLVEYRFKSQKTPQIPAVVLSGDQVWVLDGLRRYQDDFLKQHGVPVEISRIVRLALSETVLEIRSRKIQIPSTRTYTLTYDEIKRIGPFRVTSDHPNLLRGLEYVAKKSVASVTDVIRWMLDKWLRSNGYGPEE